MRSLRDVTAEALTAAGALVEPLAPEGLEVIAPIDVQQALSIPEWSRLGFGTDLPARARRVALEPDWVLGLERLMQDRGRHLRMSLAPDASSGPSRDVERLVAQQITLENATYRVGEVTPARTRYLLLSFRLTAVSDDKAEDWIQLCVNESNSAIADSMVEPLLEQLREGNSRIPAGGSDAELPPPWSPQRVEEYATQVLPSRIKLRLTPFLTGMERRMDRDLRRLHSYHSELREQIRRQLIGRPRRRDGKQDLKAESAKLDWIEQEYHSKIADMRRKYSTTVEVRLAQTLRLVTHVSRVHVSILRKKASRPMHIDFCKTSRIPERLSCESCWSSSKTFVVCDERLHLLCPTCASPCPRCGKHFCRACHGLSCIRCA